MLKLIRSRTSVLFPLAMLVACGDGSNNSKDPTDSGLEDPQTVNAEPVINPIGDQSILFGESATLSASATDDGLPNATLTPLWRFLSGPDGAGVPTFDRTDAMEVLVSFSEPGIYQFSFTVDDGEYSVQSKMQVDVQAYETTSFNSGLEVSLPANFLPSHSYDADWIYRIWQGVADCMTGEHSWDKTAPEQRRSQLNRINIYKEEDYNPEVHAHSGDPISWTSISVVANSIMPREEGSQGIELAEEMVDYLLLNSGRPIDGYLLCGYNHAGRRHALDTRVPSVEPQVTTQNLQSEDLNIVVQAKELKPSTINQLVKIAEYLTRIKGSDDHTPLKEIRIVDDVRSVSTLEIWSASGGFSVKESMVVLLREQIEDDLFSEANYLYPGYWIDQYRQTFEDYYWDDEHFEVANMSCCLPL